MKKITRDKKFTIMLSATEAKKLAEVAAQSGLSLSAWVRHAVLQASK